MSDQPTITSPEEIADEICECCGSVAPGCGCVVNLVDDEDPSVGYHSQIWWCFTHGRMAE
jgi:hypothetical protein